MKHAPSLTRSENIQGFAWLIFQFIFLPGVLGILTEWIPMDLLQVNLVFYAVNLTAVLVIFRRFLLGNFDIAVDNPGNVFFTTLFGMGRYLMMTMLVGMIILSLDPEFVNFNDETLSEMAGDDLPLLALATIVLVPLQRRPCSVV